MVTHLYNDGQLRWSLDVKLPNGDRRAVSRYNNQNVLCWTRIQVIQAIRILGISDSEKNGEVKARDFQIPGDWKIKVTARQKVLPTDSINRPA